MKSTLDRPPVHKNYCGSETHQHTVVLRPLTSDPFPFQSAFTGLKMKVEKHMRAVNSLPAELAPIDFATYK